MTRVDFYILKDQTYDASLRFACRLCLRAFEAKTEIHVHVDDATAAAAFDELLWDYPKHRFLAHDVVADTDVISPVHIGFGTPIKDAGLLINLSAKVPSFFGRFDRVAEVIADEQRQEGRDRYKYYRDRGYPLHHHNLSDWEPAE